MLLPASVATGQFIVFAIKVFVKLRKVLPKHLQVIPLKLVKHASLSKEELIHHLPRQREKPVNWNILLQRSLPGCCKPICGRKPVGFVYIRRRVLVAEVLQKLARVALEACGQSLGHGMTLRNLDPPDWRPDGGLGQHQTATSLKEDVGQVKSRHDKQKGLFQGHDISLQRGIRNICWELITVKG